MLARHVASEVLERAVALRADAGGALERRVGAGLVAFAGVVDRAGVCSKGRRHQPVTAFAFGMSVSAAGSRPERASRAASRIASQSVSAKSGSTRNLPIRRQDWM